jgi:SAM-dependent methyltransferase
MKTIAATCAICGAAKLYEFEDFADLPRVTSDARPVPPGGRLAACPTCGALQKIADANLQADLRAIYSDFALDRQSDGEEQVTFDDSGIGRPRSERLLDFLSDAFAGFPPARVLDFGCGRGATLKVAGRRWPGSALYGAELSPANDAELRRIPGFRRLFMSTESGIEGRFELIMLVHSLAHIVDPMGVLRQLAEHCEEDGRLFIQTPDSSRNLYYIVLADALTHFTEHVLKLATRLAGIREIDYRSGIAKNELTYLGRPDHAAEDVAVSAPDTQIFRQIEQTIAWLKLQIQVAERLSRSSRSFGIFGSSIAGSWLAGAMRDRVDFFVDEDPHRVGGTHMERPILAVDSVPADAEIFVPLAPNVSQLVVSRLKARGISCRAA